MSTTSVNAGITAGPRDSDALFYKVFSGEVLTSFSSATVLKERIRIRNITNGKSAGFNAIGKVTADYHQPGNVILGQKVNNGEITITIDDMLLADTFISNYEEAKLHYEVRSEYTKQMGVALAQTYDRQLFAMALKKARAGQAGPVTEIGAAQSLSIGAAPSTATIITKLFLAAQKLDEANIPSEDRFAYVSPAVFYALAQDTSLVNKWYSDSNGDYAKGIIKTVAGIDLIKTNNLAVNHTTGTTQGSQAGSATTDYAVVATDTIALVMQRAALGAVHLMDIASESEYQVSRQGSLMVSKMAVGYGMLRPDCVIELRGN
jgi:hypothetical protein